MPYTRTRSVTTKVTNEEYAQLRARVGGQTVSTWAHDVLLKAAASQPIEQVLLNELMALRTIIVNLQFMLAAGHSVTEETMRRLIERADREKGAKASTRLESPGGIEP